MSASERLLPTRVAGKLFAFLAAWVAAGCNQQPPPARSEVAPVHPAPAQVSAWHAPPAEPEASPPPERAPTQLTPLPEGLIVGTSVEVPLDGDRALRVAHAGASSERALVYLHGMCGNPKGAEPWIDRATERGTLIVVRADVPCPDRPGYKWPKELSLIQARIDRALETVKNQRAGRLNTSEVTLIGYSQGAHRAEGLAAAYPTRYPRLVLGGPPTAPTSTSFSAHQRVAVLGGELEDSSHMSQGAEELLAGGVAARFFLLPRAHHGGYGPEGRRVMDEVLRWLDAPEGSN